MADSTPELVAAHGEIARAARKVTRSNQHHPTHLGGCIGPLSSLSCRCGITDLHTAVRELDRLQAVTHRCPPEVAGFTPCCRRPVFELPSSDRLTDDPDKVTCAKETTDG